MRYGEWLAGLVQGDLGVSLRTSEPVGAAILSRLSVTIELMLLAQERRCRPSPGDRRT